MGIELAHVPYKSSAQSVIDIVTGRLDMQIATIAPVMANIRAGQLQALATTARKRPSALPELPTMQEAGVPNYDVALWLAFAMPAATPMRMSLSSRSPTMMQRSGGNLSMPMMGRAYKRAKSIH